MEADPSSKTDVGHSPSAPPPEQPRPGETPPRRSADTRVLAPATILAVAGILALVLGGFGILGTALALSGATFIAFAFRRPEAAVPLGRLWHSKMGRKVFLGVVGAAFLLGAFTGGASKDHKAGYVHGYQQSQAHGGQFSLEDFISYLASSYGVSDGEVESLMIQMIGQSVEDPEDAFDGFRNGYKDATDGKKPRWTRKDVR